MKLLAPNIFEPFQEVIASMSLRDETEPGHLSMIAKGTDKSTARKNRHRLCQELGFSPDQLAYPEQTHSDIVHTVTDEYSRHEGDALITGQSGWLLGVTVADCVPVLLYDPFSGSYGAIHSGWRGSAANITGATVAKLVKEFDTDPTNIIAWVGPATGEDSYEVGSEVASQFNQKYSRPNNQDGWLFDNKSVVYDQLISAGLQESNIEVSGLDTITNTEFHSARRDGEDSGRMLCAIGRA